MDRSQEITGTAYNLFNNPSGKNPTILVPVQIEGISVGMELDTGAVMSLMSESTYKSTFLDSKPQRLSQLKLNYIRIWGNLSRFGGGTKVEVQLDNQTKALPLIIVSGEEPTLLGRSWLTELKLNWQ